MCGIAGYVGGAPRSQQQINNTLQAMANRGPDNRTCHTHQLGSNHVTLCHARLSIIDLSEDSNQPFVDGHCSLIFNGEIYNYKEVRKALEQRGVRFTTTGDTEVLMKAYHAYGTDCVKHLEGMWAFALLDRDKNRLFLSRDRFGEKPLFYMRHNGGFFFGSQVSFLKTLSDHKPAPNVAQIQRFLVNGYKSLYKNHETFFENVAELDKAHNMVFDLASGEHKTKRYWAPQININNAMSLDQAVEGTRERLKQSVRLRLRADVPVAFCLSGGIDSSSLASMAAKELGADIKTYSIIDSDKRYNEKENVMATVNDLGCKHHLIDLDKTGTYDRLTKQIAYHDAPVLTITYYIHALLSQAVHEDGYRVVVSGTAADELFTGYFDHYSLQLAGMKNHPGFDKKVAEWKKHIAPIIRNPKLQDPLVFCNNPEFRDHIYLNSDVFAALLKQPFNEPFNEVDYSENLIKKRMANELFYEVTPTILHEDDLNSMMYSIENRSPYLDSELFGFAYSIPAEHLVVDGYNKYPLRAAMKGILNDKVRLDRHKKGFNAAFESLIDMDDPNITEKILDAASPIYDIVDRQKIMALFKLRNTDNSFSKLMFYFISSKIFLEQQAK